MRALLLAAGLGTRLRPLTDSIPKCLVPINGKPLMEYWLENLTKAGICSLLVNLHHHWQKVSDYLNSCPYASKIKRVYEEELLLTGGTLLENRTFFDNESIMLIHADNLCLCDLSSFIKAHRERPKDTDITMMTFSTETPETCGIVELDDKGVVLAFHEKIEHPPGNRANAAVYILEPTIFDFLESLQQKKIDFSTEVLPNLIGRIYTWHNDVYHRDIGTIESYAKAQIEILPYINSPLKL